MPNDFDQQQFFQSELRNSDISKEQRVSRRSNSLTFSAFVCELLLLGPLSPLFTHIFFMRISLISKTF